MPTLLYEPNTWTKVRRVIISKVIFRSFPLSTLFSFFYFCFIIFFFFIDNPNAFLQTANVIFIDAPVGVGTGFSYAIISEAWNASDKRSSTSL